MNLVQFWQDQINKWNEEEKCGLCWEFFAPLIESAVGVIQSSNPCCVQVFLLRDRLPAFSTVNNYNSQTGYVNQVTCTTSFQLLVLIPSKLGLNNYNEILGHSVEESKWNTILSQLEQCLRCELNLDFCEFLGASQRITQWSGTQVINYSDNVYAGYRISASFQTVN